MDASRHPTEQSTRGYLERTPVFTTAEFREALGPGANVSTVNNRLHQAYGAGYVERVTRGVYVSQVGLLGDRAPDPFVVASKLSPDAVLALHSALEAFGVAHSPFRRVTYFTTKKATRLKYRGYEFVGFTTGSQAHGAPDAFVDRVRRGQDLVKVTTRERTLVDCLDRLRWSGGVEEVLRSVGGLVFNVDKVLAYLDVVGSPGVTARVAWVLSAAPELWRLTDEDRAALRSRLKRGPYFFGQREQATRFVPEWSLYVPDALDPADYLHS
jgi:predicted transcriptional regulator of viral defense system